MRNFFRQIAEKSKSTNAPATRFSLSPRDTHTPASSAPRHRSGWSTHADYEVHYDHPDNEDVPGFVNTGTLRILEGKNYSNDAPKEQQHAQSDSHDAVTDTGATDTSHHFEPSAASSRRLTSADFGKLSPMKKERLNEVLETECRLKAVHHQLDTMVDNFEAQRQNFLSEKRKLEDQRIELKAEVDRQWKSLWDA